MTSAASLNQVFIRVCNHKSINVFEASYSAELCGLESPLRLWGPESKAEYRFPAMGA